MTNNAYIEYTIKAAKTKNKISYNAYKEKWNLLRDELDELSINYNSFFEFVFNYSSYLYPNVLFAKGKEYYKLIEKYLAYINSGNKISEEANEQALAGYTYMYTLTSILYNIIRLKEQEIDLESSAYSLYDLMIEYSPVIISYKLKNKELSLDIESERDKKYFKFIEDGYFDVFFSFYEKSLMLSDKELEDKYKLSYEKLTSLGDQVVTIESSIFLLGTTGTGIL
ncbi:MAG: hypothetical protein WC942_08585 [Clostridia bacterium]|jgi:hypothetical protein